MDQRYAPQQDLFCFSAPEIVHLLGARFRDYRMRVKKTQREVADFTGLTVTTIHKFESGSACNISLGTFILLLKAIGMVNRLDDLLPDLPVSPYMLRKDDKVMQRVRHKKE